MRGIPVPENDWNALNIRLDEIAGMQKILQTQVTDVKSKIQTISVQETVIEESVLPEEQIYDGPGNVFFISSSCSFTGKWPILYWEKLDDPDMKYEIRTDLNFGEATSLIDVVNADNYTVNKWKSSDGAVGIFYIKALDIQNRYSKEEDSITLTNIPPDMTAITPIITNVFHGSKKDLKVQWKAYSEPTDLAGYYIFLSASTTCPVDDAYWVDTKAAGTKTTILKGLERNPDYDVRILAFDVFGYDLTKATN